MKQCNMCGCITEDHINVCPTCGNTAFSPIMYQQQTYNNQPNYNNQPTPSITATQPAKPKKISKLFIVLPIFLAVMVIVIAVELITLSKYRKSSPEQGGPDSQVSDNSANDNENITSPISDGTDDNSDDASPVTDNLNATVRHEMSELKEFRTEYRIVSSRNGYLIVTDGERGYGFMDGTGKFILPMDQREITFVGNPNLDIIKLSIYVSENNTYYAAYLDFDGNEIARSENQGSVNGFYKDDTTAIICNPYSHISKLIDCNGNILKEYQELDNGKLFTSIVGNKYLLTEDEAAHIGQLNGENTITEVMGIYNLDCSPVYVSDTSSVFELCYNSSGYFAIFESPIDNSGSSSSFFVIDENGKKISDIPAFRGVQENNLRVLNENSFVVPTAVSTDDEYADTVEYCKIYNAKTNTLSDNDFVFIKDMIDGRAFAYMPDADSYCIVDDEGNIVKTGNYMLNSDPTVSYGGIRSGESDNIYSIVMPNDTVICTVDNAADFSLGKYYLSYTDTLGKTIYMDYAGNTLYTSDPGNSKPAAIESDDGTVLFLCSAKQDEATDTVYRDIIPVIISATK